MKQFILFTILTLVTSYSFANTQDISNSMGSAWKNQTPTTNTAPVTNNGVTIYGGADVAGNPALHPHVVG